MSTPAEPAEHKFRDPVTGTECALVIPPGGRLYPGPGQPQTGIRHPGCDVLADLVPRYDAFWCRSCQHNGRVSGAWCMRMIEESKG